jgi:hypothetical protein
VNEIWYNIVNFKIRPQRYWSTFYFRSVRAFFNSATPSPRATERSIWTPRSTFCGRTIWWIRATA